jgi:hypothetical protein
MREAEEMIHKPKRPLDLGPPPWPTIDDKSDIQIPTDFSTDNIRHDMSRDTLDRPGGEPPTVKIKLTRRTVAKAKDFLWRLFG